jgi:UDP-N-acetylglucosamine 1-carboxyvinyltransferase
MAATLLSGGTHKICGAPNLSDINTMKKLLEHHGAQVSISDEIHINTENIKSFEAPYELVKTMRASFLVLGPLIARFGRAKVSLPGGCAIGLRPVDIHIKALEAMGVEINIDQGYVNASCRQLKGAHIILNLPTVGGTENIMIASCLARGTTTIENAAREPEIVDLAIALKKMGACINGEGTDTIIIEGVKDLKPLTHTVMPDRIEAGTIMVAGGIAGSDISVKNCSAQSMRSIIEKLREAGLNIDELEDGVRVRGNGRSNPLEITTNPYPGFPTDMQAQIMTLLTMADGVSIIRETIFENRFIHVAELDRMGANIKVERDCAIIVGVNELKGASVMATDLRASASLILAGLAASGRTKVSRVYHLDRGYDRLEKKLQSLGADICREKDII